MEFKGTKGKWRLIHSKSKNSWNIIGTIVGYRYKISRCEYIINDKLNDSINKRERQEQKANALLISKAPDMLEMLIKIESILECESIEPNSPLQEQIFNLIKEATDVR